MFVKQEHPLNVNPDTKLKIKKIKNDEDSDGTVIPDNKAEEIKIAVNPDAKLKIKKIKNDEDSDGIVIPDNKAEEIKIAVNPETKLKTKKIKNDKDSDGTVTPDNKADEIKIANTETEPVVEERPIFVCKNCNLTERYDCFNDHVSFNRKVGTKVDYYLARDPFSPRSKRQFLILGSVCSMCDKDVCIKPECSIFYSKFFCSVCARKYISNFPTSIQEKIKTAKRI